MIKTIRPIVHRMLICKTKPKTNKITPRTIMTFLLLHSLFTREQPLHTAGSAGSQVGTLGLSATYTVRPTLPAAPAGRVDYAWSMGVTCQRRHPATPWPDLIRGDSPVRTSSQPKRDARCTHQERGHDHE
jgi:hypothetical protein